MNTFHITFASLITSLALGAEVSINASGFKNTESISGINAAVDKLEKRISDSDKTLPTLNVEYDLHDATEGVPPDFKFFFEIKKVGSKEKSILRVCKSHIGLEVHARDFTYYFDEEGRPMKYLVKDSGVSGEKEIPASRQGKILDKSGRTIWSSPDTTPPLSFKEVTNIFNAIVGGLEKL